MKPIFLLLLMLVSFNSAYAVCIIEGQSKCGVDGKTYRCTLTAANTHAWRKDDSVSQTCQPEVYAFLPNTKLFSLKNEIDETCTEGDKKCGMDGTIYECTISLTWLHTLDKCLPSAMPSVFGLAVPEFNLKTTQALIDEGYYRKAEQIYFEDAEVHQEIEKLEQQTAAIFATLDGLQNSAEDYSNAKRLLSRAQTRHEALLGLELLSKDPNQTYPVDPELNNTASAQSISEPKEIADIKRFVNTLTAQISSMKKVCTAQLIAAGFDNALNVDQLKTDSSIYKSINAIQEAKRIVQKFKAANRNMLESARIGFRQLSINEALKQKVGDEFDYASRNWGILSYAAWDIEFEILTECEAALQFLRLNKPHWQIKDQQLVVDNADYGKIFNAHLMKIDNLAKREDHYIQQSLDIFNNRMKIVLN